MNTLKTERMYGGEWGTNRTMRSLLFLCFGLALSVAAPGAAADSADQVSDATILMVHGKVDPSAESNDWRFDLEALRALGVRSFETSTIWGTGVQRFEGVSLHTLLAHVGAEGSTITARALNDYAVELPMSDAVEGGALVAYAVDGKPMSVRDKGPLWIVFPYDHNRTYANEIHYSRSIWQLSEIEVIE